MHKTTPLLFSVLLTCLGCQGSPSQATVETSGESAPTSLTSAPASDEATAASEPASSPDLLTRASPVYEPGPSVLASDSIDGAALRERNLARLKQDIGPVTVLQGESPLELGERICEEVVPKVPQETPILLKPNIGGFDWFKNPAKTGGDNGVSGRTTDPEFVRGVIRCLKARGHKKITVAEGWGATHDDWKRLIKVSGYEAMAKEEEVPLVAMDDDGVFDVEGDQPGKPLGVRGMENTRVPTLLIPKILAEHLDHGLFISLPKIKTHRFGVISVALKGVQGSVMYSDATPAFRQKWRSHRELGKYLSAQKKGLPEDRAAYVSALEMFAERMIDVFEVEAPHVVLAEGAPAMSGDGFQVLIPSAEKIAIGGTHPVLVDRVAAEFLGLWDNEALARELGGHKTSPLIEVAAKRLGLDLSRVEVIGDGAALLKQPRPVHYKAMAPFVIISGDAPKAEEEAAGDKPTAYAASLSGESISLDGKGDEPAWQKAPEISWETNYAGKNTGIKTRARFLWSEDGLYALFTLENTGFFVDTSLPTEVEREGLYKEDCVEIFLTPDAKRPNHYFEIETGPYGHWFDLEIDRDAKPRKEDIGWSSGARIATTQDKAGRKATIEVVLTAPEILAVLKEGARLPLGLYRMEGKSPRNYLAWSPPRTPKPNFHVPEAFGVLVLRP